MLAFFFTGKLQVSSFCVSFSFQSSSGILGHLWTRSDVSSKVMVGDLGLLGQAGLHELEDDLTRCELMRRTFFYSLLASRCFFGEPESRWKHI